MSNANVVTNVGTTIVGGPEGWFINIDPFNADAAVVEMMDLARDLGFKVDGHIESGSEFDDEFGDRIALTREEDALQWS